MKDFFFNTIQEFNDFMGGVETIHPLVSVVRVENASAAILPNISVNWSRPRPAEQPRV